MPRSGPSPLAMLNPLGGRRLVVIDPGSRMLKLLAVRSWAGRVRVRQQHVVDLVGEGVLGVEETRQHLESLFPKLRGLERAVLIPQDRTICQTVEVPVEGEDGSAPGDAVLVEIFQENEKVHVQGLSKGRGFQGVIKRHGFGGGRATHGSMFHRAPGSIGAAAYPARVFAGQKMPGQMGNKRVTVKNVQVVKVDPERNLLFLKGGVPGARNSYLRIVKVS